MNLTKRFLLSAACAALPVKKKRKGRVASQSIKPGTVKSAGSILNIRIYAKK